MHGRRGSAIARVASDNEVLEAAEEDAASAITIGAADGRLTPTQDEAW